MNKAGGLTQKNPGSLAELFVVIFPLMAISLSENMMIFFDRIILSHYSLLALNSVTLASQAIEIMQYGMWALASATEITIARLYARNKLSKLATPSWQMLYISAATLPIVFLLSIFTAPIILHGIYLQTSGSYYRVIIFSVPLIGAITALSAFFVGQGRVKIVLLSTVTTGIVNLILDFPLIFGALGIIPPLGPLGAAISAIISLLIQFIWLFSIFLNKNHRLKYSSHHFSINLKYVKRILRLGTPLALSHIGEMFGWLVLIKMVSKTSIINFTVVSIGSTLYLLFAFAIDGMFRGIVIIASYYQQLDNKRVIRRILKLSFLLLISIMLILSLPLIISPNVILALFNLKAQLHNWSHELRFSLASIWVYFTLLGAFSLQSAFIAAKGHVKSITIINVSSMWLFAILPTGIFVLLGTLRARFIWPIIDIYMLFACIAILFYSLHLSNRKTIPEG